MYDTAIRAFLTASPYSRLDINTVLFDMDGVLFDSMPAHAYAWCTTFRELGLAFSEEECYLNEGRTGSGTINTVYQRAYGRDATEAEIKHIYGRKSYLFDHYPAAPVMPGAAELLDKVRDDGLSRILVTGSGQKALLAKLNTFFPDHFSTSRMVTAYDVKKGKPHPEPYLQGLKKAGVGPNQAIVVENAPMGVESAKKAGLFVVAVNTGKLADHYLTEAGADLLFPSMSALHQAWTEVAEALRTCQR